MTGIRGMCTTVGELWTPSKRKSVAGGNRVVATTRVNIKDVALRVDRSSRKNRCSGAWVYV
jgi:hypothetical protein